MHKHVSQKPVRQHNKTKISPCENNNTRYKSWYLATNGFLNTPMPLPTACLVGEKSVADNHNLSPLLVSLFLTLKDRYGEPERGE
jgi:hypothetical protein